MISKKYLLLIFIILVVIILGMIGWRIWVSYKLFNNFNPAASFDLPQENLQEDNIIGDVSKLTDDIYAEILAQTGYQYQVTKDPKIWATKMKAIYAQYGVTGDDVKSYAEMLKNEPERMEIVSEKYMKRLMELQNFGK